MNIYNATEIAYKDGYEQGWNEGYDLGLKDAVKHGRWVSFLDGDDIMPERRYRCSKCGRVERQKEPYCHCGAKMDGE